MNYNKWIIGGRLVRDVSIKNVGGTTLGEFGVAVNRKWKGTDGSDKEEVLFVDCTAWGKTGDNIARFFQKGKDIFLEGHAKLDVWESKDGSGKRSKISFVVDKFEFVGGNRDGGTRHEDEPPETASRGNPPPKQEEDSADDIPFVRAIGCQHNGPESYTSWQEITECRRLNPKPLRRPASRVLFARSSFNQVKTKGRRGRM